MPKYTCSGGGVGGWQSLSHLVDAHVLLSIGHVWQQLPLLVVVGWRRRGASLAAGGGEVLVRQHVEGCHAGHVTPQLIVTLKGSKVETFHQQHPWQ